MTIKMTLEDRFEAKFIPEPNSGCWLWMGSCRPNGYGKIRIEAHPNRSQESAHRASWRIYRGPIPGGKFVLHSCDNKACVNPDHLYLGDHAINMADAAHRYRHARGSAQHLAKLAESDIAKIRADTRPQEQIAADYSVSQHTISQIKLKKTWRHVD